ncbi:LacI family DNA-binding transcriptional regulator [Marispirochaeta aestuarii]|uniref:LacI family DNA-binding transcriptional regulator n=1 Tax=Marispirochaeta aestuarii TaxID=1963862 RepID=UPI0029C9B057|nr:LacI family DNA-binding transcriptional regulator [Marispirochaeta aestuarii]
MATIREIADCAEVSIATVSKVLNGLPGVSRETQDTVMAAAKRLKYRPNLNARNLKMGMSRTLGIIAEDLTVFNTPGIVDGIGVCCETRNYHYILGNLRFNKRFHRDPGYGKEKTELVMDMMDEMLSKQVDGILYIGCHSHIVAPVSEQKETRFVCAYCFSEDPNIPAVNYDDREAARKVAELLISKGHRKIGIIAGPKDSLHTNKRLLGFQETLYEKDIPYNPHLTRYGDWERDQGFANAPSLLAEGVTAIFTQNDLMALGVIDYCNQNGIEVGKDLDLIGFDDREIASVCRPSLSSVSLPLFEIGHTAADIMLDMIEKDRKPESHEILLGCSIVERESTSP